ncbi:hypothetical protein ACOCG7_34080 (plasmid) [Paraburkholderia sp. DD10]|uniref:hypothetical protein n=1 Tax=Paraburkholderia sp. DD10 TaxID=3409691 RepID=UPI003BA0D507
MGETRQPALLQAALEDVHARIRRLEQANAQLHRELGEAHAARDLAGEHVNRLLGDLSASIERAGVVATTLAKAAAQLAGTERFLKMQNNAVQLQASGEADALRAQNGQLRERIDHLLLEVDQYRRTLRPDRSGVAERGRRWHCGSRLLQLSVVYRALARPRMMKRARGRGGVG